MATSTQENAPTSSGTLYALIAYTLWGLLPLYWKNLKDIPLSEALAHRVLWCLVTLLVILIATGRWNTLRVVLNDKEKIKRLGISALLIGFNWALYIYAIYQHELMQASLGYYLLPLMTVGLGVLLLGEKLNVWQSIAVGLAGIGVLFLSLQHQGFPWIALGLAVSFAFYGFAKKKIVVDPLAGLAVETLWLSPWALGSLFFQFGSDTPSIFLHAVKPTLLLIGTGIVTLSPLFFFNLAARRLPLTLLGFFQYLSPTIQLILSVTLFHESFTRLHGFAFGLIWVALGVFTWGNRKKHRADSHKIISELEK